MVSSEPVVINKQIKLVLEPVFCFILFSSEFKILNVSFQKGTVQNRNPRIHDEISSEPS